jgi:hypothetical protein
VLSRGTIAACYLAWFAQANFLQHQFDYHLVPTVILAAILVASYCGPFVSAPVRWTLLASLLLVAVAYHPLLAPGRMAAWGDCWKGNSPRLREVLGSLNKEEAVFLPTWPELAAVEQFLREHGAVDGEVVCWSNSSLALYGDLRIQPSYRYVMLSTWHAYTPARTAAIDAEVMTGPRRFIVTDLHENLGIPLPRIPQVTGLHPALFASYPWNQPVVFRAGRYLVHAVKSKPPPPTR